MASLQEVEQQIREREQQLSEAEVRARSQTNVPIPQRRYGAGVTPSQQRQAYAEREQGKKTLLEVKTQREELQKVKTQIAQQKQQQAAQQAALDQANRERALYNQAWDLIQRGKEKAARGSPELQGMINKIKRNAEAAAQAYNLSQVRTGKEEQDFYLVDGKLQLYTPYFPETSTTSKDLILQEINSKIGGSSNFLLNVNENLGNIDRGTYYTESGSYVNAQGIGMSTMSPPAGAKIVYGKDPNLPDYVSVEKQDKEYKTIFGTIEKGIEYPFEKLAEYSEKRYINATYKYGFGVIAPYEEGEDRSTKNQFEPRAIRFIGSLFSYPFYGARRVEEIMRYEEKAQEFNELPPLQKTLELADIGLSLYSLGSITSSTLKYFNQPVIVKNEKYLIPEKTIAETNVFNIVKDEKLVNLAEFKVTSISLPERAYQLKRYQALFRGLSKDTNKLKDYSIDQLKLILPEGKEIQIKPLQIIESRTETFIIEKGKILTALGENREPVIYTKKLTYNIINDKTRITGKKFSILSGENYESKTLRTISSDKNELSPIFKKGLEEIEKVNSPLKDIEVKKILNKELNLEMGGIRTEDFLRVTNKGVKIIPEGKRISRAEIAAVQEQLFSLKFEDMRSSLKEIEILREELGAVDITFPRLRTPKKALKIEGKVNRFEFDISGKNPLEFKTSEGNLNLKFDKEINQKTLQKAIGSVAVDQAKIKPTKAEISKAESILDIKNSMETSLVGLNLPKAEEKTGFKEMEAPKEFQNYPTKEITKSLSKIISKEITIPKEIPKEINKEIVKEVPKEITKSLSKIIPKEIAKETSKQISKGITKLQLKSTQKSARSNFSKYPITRKSKSKRMPIISIPKFSGKTIKIKEVTGYRPFVIKKGKRVYLGTALPKAEALFKAEKEAKNTLRATFGVEKTIKKVKDEGKNYIPSKKLFRGFRIRKGKRIKLKDMFIQKRGKRLSSPGEIAEIQKFRRLKV